MTNATRKTLVGRRSCGVRGRAGVAIAALLAALSTAGAGSAPTAISAPAKPNFVVLMTDDQTNGEMLVMRKTLSLIGAKGITFNRLISSFPLCCPARVSFLTGQYSHNHGVLGNGTPIGGYPALDKQDTLARWLQSAGYQTIQIGKFLNGYPRPNDRTEIPPGWDEWHGAVHSAENLYFNYTLNEDGRLVRYGSAGSDYSTDVLRRKAVAAIKRRAAAPNQPFFLFAAFTAPHLPAEPAPRDRGRFRNRALPRARSFNERDVSDKPGFIRSLRRLSPAKIRRITDGYRDRVAALLAVDRAVADLVAELRRGGLLGNTYILFLSDNGFFFGQHRLPKGKYLPYEGSIRVPAMLRGPGIPAGARTDELLANVDLAPTFLELAGASATVAVDGRSMLPFIRTPGRRSDRPILLEANTVDDPSIGIPYTGILTERFKYIRYRSGEQELYDLARDPGELTSRHGDPRYQRTRAALAARLARLRSCDGASCRAATGPIPNPR